VQSLQRPLAATTADAVSLMSHASSSDRGTPAY